MNLPETSALWVVLSDIHANHSALQAVTRDAYEQASEIGVAPEKLRYISLGDVVDCGPDPGLCLDWVQTHCVITVGGNHDLEASKYPDEGIDLVKKELWPVLVWTRCQLTNAQRQRLRQMGSPGTVTLGSHAFALGHATLAREDRRQDASLDHQTLFRQLETAGAGCGLVGHTHNQLIWLSDFSDPILPEDRTLPKSTDKGWLSLSSLRSWWGGTDRSVVFNPGGLGQPRSVPGQQLKACVPYLLLDTRGPDVYFKFRRIVGSPQPHEATAERIRRIRLPGSLPTTCDPNNHRHKLSRSEIAYIYANLEIELQDLILSLETPPLRQGI